jgi:release factor glutamine methyltransferase
VGTTTFCEAPLLTAPGRVMTPRPATEHLVAAAAERLHAHGTARVADVGTGSGAIALALAQRAPGAEVWASDTSPAAVALAARNALRLGLSDRVHVRRGDLLEPLPGEFDLIVANLPYLPEATRPQRPELSDEPDEAVFAPGDGLGPYRRLFACAEERLSPGGAVLIQFHRRVLVAEREELAAFEARLAA